MCTFYGVVDSRPDNRQTHEADARDDEVGRGPEGEDSSRDIKGITELPEGAPGLHNVVRITLVKPGGRTVIHLSKSVIKIMLLS